MKENMGEKNQRVVTFLNRDEVDFLDKLGKDALFSTGMKLSRAKLIAWLVDLMKGLGISGENITSEQDLERRVLEVVRQISQEGSVPSHGRVPLKEEEKDCGVGGAPQSHKGGMMKKTIAFAAAVVLVPVLPLYAQTVNIPVRCTVPAIPGVNTPLIEKGESAGNGYISGDGQEKTSDGRMVKTFYPR